MTYDFFVLPATSAEDLEQATAAYESAPQTGSPSPDGPVDAFLATLAPFGFEAHGTDAGVYVATSWDDPMARLREVAEAAAEHGLAVLDVQLAGLYDPRGALPVGLETQGGPRLTYVTRRILADVMSHIRERRYHWVTLDRGVGVFVQTYHDDDGSWALEHREGPGAHFASRTDDDELVERVLWSWARGDGRWQAMVAFSPVRL